MSSSSNRNKIIGENIKAARKIKGLSQRDLAEKLGIAFQNLSVWENGKGAPSARYLMQLSEVLKISLDQLTSDEGLKANLEKNFAKEGKFDGMFNDTSGIDINALSAQEIPDIVERSIAESTSIKLIVKYLEQILEVLEGIKKEH